MSKVEQEPPVSTAWRTVIDGIKHAFYAGESWVSLFSQDGTVVANATRMAVEELNNEYETRHGKPKPNNVVYVFVQWDPIKKFTALHNVQRRSGEQTVKSVFKDWDEKTGSSTELAKLAQAVAYASPMTEPFRVAAQMLGSIEKIQEAMSHPAEAIIVMVTGLEEMLGSNTTLGQMLKYQLTEIINSGVWSRPTSRRMIVCRDTIQSAALKGMESLRHVINVPLPSIDDHFRNVKMTVEQPDLSDRGKLRYNIDEEMQKEIAYRLTGMGEHQGEVAVAMTVSSMDTALRRNQPMTPELRNTFLTRIEKLKAETLKRGQNALTLRSLADISTINALRGYDGLMYYVGQRDIPREDAALLQLPELKGLLLAGLPGTGKSLAAAAIAQRLRRAMLELNLGLVLGGLVGDSERNLDECLKIIDAQGKVVVLLDEAEKAFAGSRGSAGDSGVATRLLGRFLAWLGSNVSRPAGQPIIVMTANRPDLLPAELLRAGRIDRIFGVRPPTKDARIDILKAHFACRNVVPFFEDDEWLQLGDMTERDGTPVVGAVLEAAVKDAMVLAYQRTRETAKGPSAIPTLAEMKAALRQCMRHDSSKMHETELQQLQLWLNEHCWSVESVTDETEEETPVSPAVPRRKGRDMR